MTTTTTAAPAGLAERVAAADWAALAGELDASGSALTPPLLDPEECRAIAELYDQAGLFRSTVDMARYRFGAGQYRYFREPLPDPVQQLRTALYPRLLPVVRDWAARLGRPAPWPGTLEEWLARCHEAGHPARRGRQGRGGLPQQHPELDGLAGPDPVRVPRAPAGGPQPVSATPSAATRA